MIRKSRFVRVGCGVLTIMTWLCLVTILPVSAYVLSGPHVLELMARTLDKAQALRIVQKVVVEDSAFAAQPLVLNETLSYFFPGRLRSEITRDSAHRIQVVSFDQTLTIIDGKRTNDSIGRAERYKDLLLYRSRPLLHKMLLTYGVDVEQSSLGRFEDKVVWVIGAQYPDESMPQVWVDKDSFLPMRWLDISPEDSNDRWEYLYRQWQKKGDEWYPLKVEIYRNGRLIRNIEVADIVINPDINMESFDIPSLRMTFPAVEKVEPIDSNGADSEDEVKRTIEEFQKKFDE